KSKHLTSWRSAAVQQRSGHRAKEYAQSKSVSILASNPFSLFPSFVFGFSPYVINVLWVLTVLNRTAAITCQARPDIEIRRDPTTQILAISLKERFVCRSESGG